MREEMPLHLFHKLRNISFTAQSQSSREVDLPDGFDALLDMMPSLQKILLPPGCLPSNPDETQIDLLARKLLEQSSFCPNLQDIGSPVFPTDWAVFLQMLASRCLKSLLSPTGYPKSIHTLRFPVLPHPHIIQQLEDAMSGRQLTPYYIIPPCEELCTYTQGKWDPGARTHQKSKVCFKCHCGRLEKGCRYRPEIPHHQVSLVSQSDNPCLRWAKQMDSWEIISV